MNDGVIVKNKRVSPKKVKGLVMFQLSSWPTYISAGAALLINLTISLIINASIEDGGGGSIDFAMLAVGIVFGVFVAALGLKFSMVNGASRKTYFLSALITVFIGAIAYALVTFLAMLLTHSVGHTNDAYYLLYGIKGGMNWGGVIFFELCAMFLSMTLGFFAALVVYRTKKRGKLILLVAAVLVAGAATLLGFFTDFWAGLGKFLINVMGLNFATPNPFIGGLSLLAISAALFAVIYFIVRRADIRE